MKDYALPDPYLLFIADLKDPGFAKTAFGLRDWAPERCVGQWRLTDDAVSVGLSELSPEKARHRGAKAMIIAVAPAGGIIQPHWLPALVRALEAGLDLISGMHTRLSAIPELVTAAARCDRRLHDVRVPPPGLTTATGRRRSGLRLLTVGTDCALGKKYTALSLTRAFRERGLSADFRATGQTGIMIAGSGVPIDSVIADFVAGAAEALSPDNESEHWDVIEGQGSLFHPAYAGVSLGLLHGSQPDVLVLCHEAGRTAIHGLPEFPLPSLREAMDLNVALARRVNRDARCAAVSLNTAKLSEAEARKLFATVRHELHIPCADPLRRTPEFSDMVDACLEHRSAARPKSDSRSVG